MLKNIENRLESFVRAELAGVHRIEMTHGTMYLVLDKPGDCDFIHKEIRKFYKENTLAKMILVLLNNINRHV